MLYTVDSRGWTANTAWCVPTAISYLTGAPLIHTHSRAAFMQNIPLTKVEGVYGSEAAILLREQSYTAKPIDLAARYSDAPKLKQFMNDRTAYEKCMPLMIQVENKPDFCHMIVAHYGYAADNWTMKPVPIENFPHINRYVTKVWIVEKGRVRVE